MESFDTHEKENESQTHNGNGKNDEIEESITQKQEEKKENEENKKNSLEDELAEIRQQISTKNELNQTIKN